jgi:hypothetical protein
MIYKTLHRKLRIGQDAFHEYREWTRVHTTLVMKYYVYVFFVAVGVVYIWYYIVFLSMDL